MAPRISLFERRRRRNRFKLRLVNHSSRPRLCVFRSNRYIYAQLIDDARSCTLAHASSIEKDMQLLLKGKNDRDAAKKVGVRLAERATKLGYAQVVFDRGGYPFHGRIRALAEGAREGGLSF